MHGREHGQIIVKKKSELGEVLLNDETKLHGTSEMWFELDFAEVNIAFVEICVVWCLLFPVVCDHYFYGICKCTHAYRQSYVAV